MMNFEELPDPDGSNTLPIPDGPWFDKKPFTFEYDATEGVLIAAALREKASSKIEESEEYRSAIRSTPTLRPGFEELARVADNQANLFIAAADRIHAPVKVALAEDMDAALRKAGL